MISAWLIAWSLIQVSHSAPASLASRTRAEDEAAAMVFRSSLGTIRSMINQKKNTKQEPELLSQYAETLNRMAAVQFRLVHSIDGPPLDINQYHQTLDEIVKTETRLITAYSSSKDAARFYFLRARALKELNKNTEAANDFRYMIDRYPITHPDIPNAVFSLYDALSRAQDYKTAVFYLKKLEGRTHESYYPLLLDNLAFAHYYLNDIPNALHYSELELKSLQSSKDHGGQEERSKVLKNCVLFYFTAMSKGMPQYSSHTLFPYLQSLNPGSAYSEVLKYLSYLFRSKGRDQDLEGLKKEVLVSKLSFTDTLEFLLAVFQNEINKRNFPALQETVGIFDRLAQQIHSDSRYLVYYNRIYQILGASVTTLQANYSKASPTHRQAIEGALSLIFQALLKSTKDVGDQQKIHFNLAELAFQKKSFDEAAQHYLWVIQQSQGNPKTGKGNPFYEQSRVKLLSARYEALLAQNVFPKETKALPLGKAPKIPLSDSAREWTVWVRKLFSESRNEILDPLMVEAGRLLYVHGEQDSALALFKEFLGAKPASEYAPAAASLVLDTELASGHWQLAYSLSLDYLKRLTRIKPEFRSKLQQIGIDSYFKILEDLYQHGRYADVLQKADLFLKVYGNNARRVDCLSLAGNAALALKDRKRAMQYFDPLMKEKGAGREGSIALLTSGEDAQENFKLDLAAGEYFKYLSLPPEKRSLGASEIVQLQKKTLLLAWISSNRPLLTQVIQSPLVCVASNPELSDLCQSLSAYLQLVQAGSSKQAWMRWKSAPPSHQAILGALAMLRPNELRAPDRLEILQKIGSQWEEASSLMKFALLPYLTVSIPTNLKKAAVEMRSQTPLQLNKVRIEARSQGIKRLEGLLQELIRSSWARIRIESHNEWANLYSTFADDIRRIPKPPGLSGESLKTYESTVAQMVAPFVKKALELRKKAFDEGMEKAIESSVFLPIEKLALMENPALGHGSQGSLVSSTPLGVSPDLSLYLLGLSRSEMNPQVSQWLNQSLTEKSSLKLAYLSQDVEIKKRLKATDQSWMQALSLTAAGAQSEGLDSLKELLPQLQGAPKALALFILIKAYYEIRSPQIKTYLSEIKTTLSSFDSVNVLTGAQQELIAAVSRWLGESDSEGAPAISQTAAPVAIGSPLVTPSATPLPEPSVGSTPIGIPSASPDLVQSPVPSPTPSSSLDDSDLPLLEAP